VRVSERQRDRECYPCWSEIEGEGGGTTRKTVPRATTAGLAVARRRSLFFLPACATPLDSPNVCSASPPRSYYRASSLLLRCPLLAGQPRALTANGINPEHTASRCPLGASCIRVYIYIYIYIYIYLYTYIFLVYSIRHRMQHVYNMHCREDNVKCAALVDQCYRFAREPRVYTFTQRHTQVRAVMHTHTCIYIYKYKYIYIYIYI